MLLAQAVSLPKVFAVLDLDGNGRIGFEEWLLFVTFLSLPPDEIEGVLGVHFVVSVFSLI